MDKEHRILAKLKDQQTACANHNDDTFVDNHMEATEIPYGSPPYNDFMRNKKGLQEGLQNITRNIMNEETYIPHKDEPKIDYSKFEVKRTLVLSTGHLPASVAKLLDSQRDEVKRGVDDFSAFHGYTDYGYKFYTPVEDDVFDYFGSDVEKILIFAREELNCDYVEFDADGKLYEEFKQFDW